LHFYPEKIYLSNIHTIFLNGGKSMPRISELGIFVISITLIWSTPTACVPLHHERYTALQQLLDQYTRTITIAFLSDDIHLPFMVAKHYPSVCVIIDGDNNGTLEQSCRNHIHNRSTILLKTEASSTNVRHLGECEHIDVCFVSTLVNRCKIDWQKKSAIQAAKSLAEYCLIESEPHTYDILLKEGGDPIATYCGRTLFSFYNPKTYLARRSWFKKAENNYMYSVESNFIIKNFKKKKWGGAPQITPWVAGINLQSFRELNGAFPSHSRIRDLLYTLRDIKHNDLFIFNLVIQGDKIVPIDANEIGRNKKFSSALRRAIAAFRYPWIHV
jgi:hypothetical protein